VYCGTRALQARGPALLVSRAPELAALNFKIHQATGVSDFPRLHVSASAFQLTAYDVAHRIRQHGCLCPWQPRISILRITKYGVFFSV